MRAANLQETNLTLGEERVDRWLTHARDIRQARRGHVLPRAQICLVVATEAAAMQSTAGPKVIRVCKGRQRGGRHGGAAAVVACLVPTLSAVLELRVEKVRLEAYLHVGFASDKEWGSRISS